MAEYITKEQVVERFRPYGHTDEPIPFETLVADLRDCIPAADVTPVRHGKIVETIENGRAKRVFTCCGEDFTKLTQWYMPPYCPNCGAKMDGG